MAATPTLLATLAMGLLLSGLVGALIVDAITPKGDPRVTYLSDHNDSPWRVAFMICYVAIGLGGMTVGLALARLPHAGIPTRLGASLVGATGATVASLAIWPAGAMHLGLVRFGEGAMFVGVGLLAYGIRDRPGWALVTVLSWAVVGMAAAGLFRAESWFAWPGLVQRVFVFVVISWAVAAARAAGGARLGTFAHEKR